MRITFGNELEGLGSMVADLGGKVESQTCVTWASVPPGFTISTAACRAFYDDSETFPDVLATEIERGIRHIEALAERRLGGPGEPLLVSVRSGAAISMPGMMDTILNVGLNQSVMEVMAGIEGGAEFALDSYRRFIEMFAEIALGLDPSVFAAVRDDVLALARVRSIQALDHRWHRGLVDAYLKALSDHGLHIPDDPRLQIRLATIGVFRSWNTRRAKRFRQANGISDDLGTAVGSGDGVPEQGRLGHGLLAEIEFRNFWRISAEISGEVSSVDASLQDPLQARKTAWAMLPDAYAELVSIGERLEGHYRDVQDLEFTVSMENCGCFRRAVLKAPGRHKIRG